MASGTLDLLGGLAVPSSDPPPLHPQTPTLSQLTIFYSGTVNVYNDVPADKAHAIMLLLANSDEKHSRSMDASVVPSNVNVSASSNPASAMMLRPPVGASPIFKQPLSRASTPPPPPTPMSPFSAPQSERKPQLMGKRTQAELPFARKASLARFLEKRKDRVQAKLDIAAEDENGEGASKRLKGCDDDTLPSK